MTTPTPAGWYSDPAGSGQQRYFDGNTWTEQYAPGGNPTPPVSAPPKKKSRKILYGVAAAVVLVIIIASVSGKSGTESASGPASAQQSSSSGAVVPPLTVAPPVSGSQIKYEVQSDGPLSSVSYFNEINDMTQLTDQPADWSASFDGKATYQMHSMSAQTTGTQVSCRITVGGDVIAEQSATGRYAVVTCAG